MEKNGVSLPVPFFLLVTDAFRALVLRIMGFRTDVIELVGTEHTARNLMIRAVRGTPVGEAAFVSEYLEMRRFWGVTPYIEGTVGEQLVRHLGDGASTPIRPGKT